jgi:two-component system, NarL family, nitrate/nitrite sensor histidine kinase NarX
LTFIKARRLFRPYGSPMSRPLTLSAKLGAIGAALLLTALVSIGLTLWVTWQLEGGAAAVNEAGRMRMQTWQLAQALPANDRARIESLAGQFDRSLELLQQGDPSRPLFVPHDADTQARFVEVRQGWLALRGAWTAWPAPAAPGVADSAEAFVARIDAFVSAIESQLARWTAVLNLFQLAMVLLVLRRLPVRLQSAGATAARAGARRARRPVGARGGGVE